MRHHFHRCPNLRVVSVDASELSGDRKGGSTILEELCEAKKLDRCSGLADCEILSDKQRRDLLVARVTHLRELEGGRSAVADVRSARREQLAELAALLLEERGEIVEANRRMLAEAAAAFDDRPDGAPLGADEDLRDATLSLGSPALRSARLDAIDRALEEIGTAGFGVCLRCGGSIEIARLHHAPDSHVCDACALSARPLT
jgi:RNA polymerase-binding transcription factor DksA